MKMTAHKKTLRDAGMNAEQIREVEGWIRGNRKVVIHKEPGNGISEIFTIEAETGSLEVLEL